MDDLISRQAAIFGLMKEAKADGAYGYIDTKTACDVIKELPTAEKKGRQIDYCGGVKCDQCGFECDDTYYLGEANFCPNCGARMEESGE